MALMDFIATGKEAEQLIQHAEDLQNQVDTAGLQHQNDLATIANDHAIISRNDDQIEALAKQLQQAQIQLLALESVTVYPDLEYGFWQLNLKPDTASGRGTSDFAPADNPKTPSLFSIAPYPPLTGQPDNYFNVYATQKKKPNAAVTNFVLTGQFDFPTDADMKNAHCIEGEARQVLKIVAPATLPLMAVPAFQMNFSGNALRYFNALAPGDNWIPTGIPMPRQRSVSIAMEAHRDEKTLYYDAFTINGVRHAVSFQAPLYAKTYVNERLSVSLQLDSHYLAGPFKVSPSGVDLKVW